MNVSSFIVKFLGWIVAVWVKLAKLIGEKGGLRFWKENPITKIKYIITILKKKMDPRGPGPYLGSSL